MYLSHYQVSSPRKARKAVIMIENPRGNTDAEIEEKA
jgi:hypothetical protein